MAGLDDYSTTPSANTAINGIDIGENCLPSGINNAIRQLMADVRKFANDIGAMAVSTGTDTVTLTTETGLAAYADGTLLVFVAGGTNTGPATLNVDGVGAKAIRKGADVALAAGDIQAGMVCVVVYDASANSAAGAWLLANPYVTLGSYQPLDAALTAIAGLAKTDGNIIVGDGSTWVAESGATARASLGLAIGTDVQAYDADTAKLDVEDQTLAGGARVTVKDLGNLSGNTITPDPGDRPMQKITNNGAGTIAPGSNVGCYLIILVNSSGAGSVTQSGWTKVSGATLTTTNGHKFLGHAVVTADFSSLIWTAMQ